MYVYRIVENSPDNGQNEFYLTHKKKYDQGEFEQLLYETRNTLRPFMTIYGVIRDLEKDGFQRLQIQAEDEFDAEN